MPERDVCSATRALIARPHTATVRPSIPRRRAWKACARPGSVSLALATQASATRSWAAYSATTPGTAVDRVSERATGMSTFRRPAAIRILVSRVRLSSVAMRASARPQGVSRPARRALGVRRATSVRAACVVPPDPGRTAALRGRSCCSSSVPMCQATDCDMNGDCAYPSNTTQVAGRMPARARRLFAMGVAGKRLQRLSRTCPYRLRRARQAPAVARRPKAKRRRVTRMPRKGRPASPITRRAPTTFRPRSAATQPSTRSLGFVSSATATPTVRG